MTLATPTLEPAAEVLGMAKAAACGPAHGIRKTTSAICPTRTKP
jgi:hypothetical protein